MRNITSSFPIFKQKTFLDEEKIILSDHKEVYFKDVSRIVVRPMGWIYFLHRTCDLSLTTKSGDNVKLYTITTSGTNDIVNAIKNANPTVTIEKLTIETEVMIGFFRTGNASDGIRVSPRISIAILAIAISIFIILIIWLNKF